MLPALASYGVPGELGRIEVQVVETGAPLCQLILVVRDEECMWPAMREQSGFHRHRSDYCAAAAEAAGKVKLS